MPAASAGATLRAAIGIPAAPDITAAATTSQPTCDQRGQGTFLKRRLVDPHPHYWAPSRYKADTRLGAEDDDLHLKVHRLEWRWKANGGLAWVCSDKPGDRNIELEAKVFPEAPNDDDPRWSDNWESNSARKYTQTNMPGNIHQDDIAVGDNFPYVDKQYYPDFAILAQSSRAFRYRKLYFLKFTTNEGQTDDEDELVIYSGQATSRATGTYENGYCSGRFNDYKSCMFSRVDVCWAFRTIRDGPNYTKYDWWDGGLSNYSQSVSQWPSSAPVENGREVNKFCDPRPPGSNRD